MKVRIETLLAVSLLASTALVPAAIAQQNQQPEAAAEPCGELGQVIEEHRDRFEDQWIRDAETAIEDADAEVCRTHLEEARTQIGEPDAAAQATSGADAETDADAAIEAEIGIDQPPPEVTVEQQAPDIAVTQPRPQVIVRQQQPRITVRQAEPVVRVQIPEPTITVEMPEPEITVEMPEPEVEVMQARPQIDVEQARPDVTVEQADPELTVDTAEVEQGGQEEQAEVQLQQDEAQVEMQGGQQADVQVEQAEPQVSYEAAEPRVIIEGAGEQQPDQPARQAVGEGDGDQPPATDMQREDAGAAEWRGDRQAFTAPQVEREGYQQLQEVDEASLDDLSGASVYDANDESIGSVSDVVVDDQGNAEHLVVNVGGFLGIGAKQVAIGFDEVTILRQQDGDELRIYVDATQQQLEEAPEYQPAN
ncbi:MAG TPA: PRC-barrel domain-containing protein [Paracoccaceae bacterium]|nr:PRC-barrel domain-containing protein [Paracoccaceae bacterium]